jgi:hypothetical protein
MSRGAAPACRKQSRRRLSSELPPYGIEIEDYTSSNVSASIPPLSLHSRATVIHEAIVPSGEAFQQCGMY